MVLIHKFVTFRKSVLICLISLFCIPVVQALEPTRTGRAMTEGISVSIGLEFDSGDYGTPDTTDTWRIPMEISYSKGPFFAGASIPYISSESTGIVIISGGGTHGGTMRTATTSSTASSVSGLGDLGVYAGYNFPPSGKINYRVTAHIKLGTADENDGLGTGENDYILEAGMYTLVDTNTVFASIGYQVTGDTAIIDYDNVFYANAGISFPHTSGNASGIMLDYAQAATPGFDDPVEVTGFMNMILADKSSMNFHIMLGLSDGSPDYGFGVMYQFAY